MQPTYLPWAGIFDLMAQADKYVFYDDVQLVKRSWNVRNRIKNSQGELYLTIPVKKTKSRSDTLICDAVINDDEKWRDKHVKSIKHAYLKAPYYNEVMPFVESLILSSITVLSEFNIFINTEIARKIGLQTSFLKSSSLKTKEGKKDLRLAAICKEIHCNNYLSPQGSAAYIELEKPGGVFPENGINLFYHHYQHPEYPQLHGEFLPYMSILDLLFNCGFDDALDIIQSGRKKSFTYLEYRKEILSKE
jgi:hypothetical protein